MKPINHSIIVNSFVLHTILRLFQEDLIVVGLTLFFYISLFFSSSTKIIALLAMVYCAALYVKFRQLTLAVFLAFIATMPFAKGLTYEIFMLSKQVIPGALNNVSYFMHFYISDIFLCILSYLVLRKSWNKPKQTILDWRILIGLGGFFLIAAIKLLDTVYPAVIALSLVEVARLIWIFFLGKRLELNQDFIKKMIFVLVSFVIFQAGWVILQRFSGGTLGRNLEVYLQGEQFGVRSMENQDLYRSAGTFFEPSILGSFMVMQLALLLSLLRLQKKIKNKTKIIYFLGICAAAIAILFTGSRGVYLVALFVGIIAIFFWRNDLREIVCRFSWRYVVYVGFTIFILSFPFLSMRLSSIYLMFTPSGSASYRIILNL